MIIRKADDVTVEALSVMGRATDPRLRKIMISLVARSHAFVNRKY
jgi:hypothetical protein